VERVLLAGRAAWFYAGKLFWPAKLTFIYPRWQVSQGVAWQYAFPLAGAAAIAALWLLRRRVGKGAIAAVLLFVATLAPALGFFNVYPMRYSYVADHFQYLASLGLIVLFSAVAWRASQRLAAPRLRRAGVVARVVKTGMDLNRPAIYAALAGILVLLGALTWRQGYDYRDIETLWNQTVKKNPSCFMAYNNLGVLYSERGRPDMELLFYRKALELKPKYAEAHYNVGNALDDLGDSSGALSAYQKAIELEPNFSGAHNNLALLLDKLGRREDAYDHWRLAIRQHPKDTLFRLNFAESLLKAGRYPEAIEQSAEVIGNEPRNDEGHYYLGCALLELGQTQSGILRLQEALRLNPHHAEARSRLQSALSTAAPAASSPTSPGR
jgi:tetratricopeptide (TPR) repeat protein